MTNLPEIASESPDRQIWLDGELIPWSQATVHVLSHSLQRGSLVFDYMSVSDTPRGWAVFRLADHVERFLRSAELVGLPLALDRDEIGAAIVATLRANPAATAVKISAYLASVEIDVVPVDDHVTVAVAAYDPIADIAKGQSPVKKEAARLWIEKERRNRRRDILDPQAKAAGNYVSPMAAKWLAKRRGYDDVLLIDEEGCIAEGPTTNVFLFDSQGVLYTPPEHNVLLGVTRRSILDIAKHDGLEVHERPVRPDELLAASEAFLTGTTAGVWPIVEIDDCPIGDGEVGEHTRALRERFVTISTGRDPDFDHWLTYVEPD